MTDKKILNENYGGFNKMIAQADGTRGYDGFGKMQVNNNENKDNDANKDNKNR